MMAITNYKYGVASFGMPVLPGTTDVPSTGNVFFVDSGTGSDNNTGKDPTHAVSTLAKAIALCTASNGDVIYIMEGHAQNLTAATTCSVAGVKIIGLGVGRNRPTFTYTGTGGKITLSGTNVSLRNVVLKAGIASVTTAVAVTGADTEVSDCTFDYGTSTYGFLIGIDVGGGAGAARCKIERNTFIAENSKVVAYDAIRYSTASNIAIRNNTILGNYATGLIYSRGTASVDIVIDNNVGRNDNATYGYGIRASVADTGIISYNRYTTALSAGTAVDSTFDPGAAGCVENYVSRESAGGNNDKQAFLVPVNHLSERWRVTYCDATAFKGNTTNKRGDDGGTSDPYTVAYIKGTCEVKVYGYCGTSTGDGATATLSVGVTGATGVFLAKTSSTAVNAGLFTYRNAIVSASPSLTGPGVIVKDKGILEWVYADNIGTGYVDYIVVWRPLLPGSEVRSA